MWQVPQALHHSPTLLSIPAMGARTPAAAEAAGAHSEIPLSSSPPWDEGSWGVDLDEPQ
jgi:hypothetical protein